MRLHLLLTLAVCLTSASASTFGRFGQLNRDPYRLGKRTEIANVNVKINDGSRFRNAQTQRRSWSLVFMAGRS